jgi:hypothetical protein
VRVAVDPNDDSDLDVEDGFFKNGFSRECSAIQRTAFGLEDGSWNE